jgi:hypothetical protein
MAAEMSMYSLKKAVLETSPEGTEIQLAVHLVPVKMLLRIES